MGLSRVTSALALFAAAILLGFPATAVAREVAQGVARGGAGESKPTPEVVRVRIEGGLDAGTASLLARGIRAAGQAGAGGGPGTLVVELDTPGGEIELMWRIAGQLDAAAEDGVRTVAWVNDRALSAGVLVAMACERIYMRPEGTLGAAAPVTIMPGGGIGQIPDPTVQEKVTSAVRASFRAWAESHGRPPALAESMVDIDVGVREVTIRGERRLMTQSEYDDVRMRGEAIDEVRTIVEVGRLASVTGAEAVRFGMADGLAGDLDELLEKVGHRGSGVLEIERTNSEDLAGTLYALRWLLLLIGISGAYLEFKLPGFGVPGILSIAAFSIFLFGQYLIGLADVPHIVAVVLGLALLAAEIFLIPGGIWVGLSGGVLLLVGLVLALGGVSSGLAYPLDRAILFDTSFDLAMWSVAALAVSFWLSRSLLKLPAIERKVMLSGDTGSAGAGVAEVADLATKRGLVGSIAVAVTDLRPVGRVVLEGAASGGDLEARTEGPALDRGQRVRIIGVSSGRLVVAPASDSEAARGASEGASS